MRKFLPIIIALTLMAPAVAAAQAEKPAERPVMKKTVIDFDEHTVVILVCTIGPRFPRSEWAVSRYSDLVEARRSFRFEMGESVNDL